jgi:glycogen synthase
MMYGCVVVARRLGCVAHDVQGVHFLEILGRHEDSGGYIKIGPDDNGFIFERYDCDEFFNSAMDALDVYESAGWNEVRSHAMRQSFSFEQTANDCMKIYEALKG